MKLIGCNASDFGRMDPTYGPHRSFAPTAQLQEPIHVQVRIRPYAEALPEITGIRAGGPHPARLPVGAILDCYA
jgi:hypothetical protein